MALPSTLWECSGTPCLRVLVCKMGRSYSHLRCHEGLQLCEVYACIRGAQQGDGPEGWRVHFSCVVSMCVYAYFWTSVYMYVGPHACVWMCTWNHFSLLWEPYSPFCENIFFLHLPALGLQAYAPTPGFLYGLCVSNSDPHACISPLPTISSLPLHHTHTHQHNHLMLF